jgi:hypothetical protein
VANIKRKALGLARDVTVYALRGVEERPFRAAKRIEEKIFLAPQARRAAKRSAV